MNVCLQFFTYWLLKVVLSALFVFVIVFSARELFRLWSDPPITLAPFSYQLNGTENEGQGKAFSQRVYHQLRDLQKLFAVDKRKQAPGDHGRDEAGATHPQSQAVTGAAPRIANSLEPPPFSFEIVKSLTIPELKTDYLPGIELKVQGVDFASLARLLARWAGPTDEFGGSIVQDGDVFSTFLERRRSGDAAADDSRFGPDSHPSLNDAVFGAGCNILYVLAKSDNQSLQKLSSTEFELLVRALRDYSSYRTAVTEMRSEDEIKKAQMALDEAARLISGLIARGVGDRFSSVYLLAAVVANSKGDARLARDRLVAYRSHNPGDPKADEVERHFSPAPQQAVATTASVKRSPTSAAVLEELSQTSRFRPIQPGISVASVGANVGTLCCIVRQRKHPEKTYLLCADRLSGAVIGSRILQPSPADGGSAERDQIATVTTYLPLQFPTAADPAPSDNRVAGTLAEIANPTQVDPTCYQIGAFTGVADAQPGDEVKLVGRTSGVTTGSVVAVDTDVRMNFGTDSTPLVCTFAGVFLCRGTANRPFSQTGDSGAPVVNAKKQLIGMALGSIGDETVVLPIVPILAAFGVSPVL